MGSLRIEPEHLLLGILASYRAALQPFISSAVSDLVEKELRQEAVKGAVKIGDDVDLPLSPGSKRVLNVAAESARIASHAQIDTSDLVVGLIREESALTARVLEDPRGKE